MSGAAHAGVLPRLEAFDDEFGGGEAHSIAPARSNAAFKLSTVIGLALAAGAISALALGWPNGPEAAKSTQRAVEKPEAAVERLMGEVEMLKREIRELTEEQQRAAHTIAALQAAEQEQRGFATWYSDLAALTYGFRNQSDASAAVPGRRAAVRSRPREVEQRDETAPLSLDPPQ
jgi:FtsZ-binding cell division protein ZapB